MDSVITKPTSSLGAISYLSSLLFNLYTWNVEHALSIGIFTVFAGISGQFTTMLDTRLDSILPFISEAGIFTGLLLSAMGVVGKFLEFRKTYLKKKKKHKK